MAPPNEARGDYDGGGGTGAGACATAKGSTRSKGGGGSGGGNSSIGGNGSSGGGGSGGGGGNSSSVPGRIGRPPQWTSTRSRKLARLYMYTTLSVDKILSVLEDDVFKPRKNSAQKTIHNMLDHDPRYLRPESRADMNQRLHLLGASSQRTRKAWKKRQAPPPPVLHLNSGPAAPPGPPGPQGTFGGPHTAYYQQPHQPHHPQQQPQRAPYPPQDHPQASYQQAPAPPPPSLPPPQSYAPHTPHHHAVSSAPSHLAHAPQYDDVMLQSGLKPELGHSMGLGHLPPRVHATHQHPPPPQQQQHHHHASSHPQLPHPHTSHHQASYEFLPPPPSSLNTQSYAEFYHPQYDQQPQAALSTSLHQMGHDSIPPFIGGWGSVYDHHQPQPPPPPPQQQQHQQHQPHHPQQHQHHSVHHTEAPFGLPAQGSSGLTPFYHPQQQQQQQQQQHQHQHQHQHQPQQHHPASTQPGLPHLDGLSTAPTARDDMHHMSMYAAEQHDRLGAAVASGGGMEMSIDNSGGGRRMSMGAYSTDSNASSDVSTETIQILKNRLSGCSTHYANQVANLLRRFTISDGSDDAAPSPGLGSGSASSELQRLRTLRRQRQRRRQQRRRRHTQPPSRHVRSASMGSHSSTAGSFDLDEDDWDGEFPFDDEDVYGEVDDGGDGSYDGTDADDNEDAKQAAGLRSTSMYQHTLQQQHPDNGGGSSNGSPRSSMPCRARLSAPRILGAGGDSVGSARLVLPGDFLNAYQYRNDATCPYHGTRSRSTGGEDGSVRLPLPGDIPWSRREHRCWCAVADAVTAAAVASASTNADDGSANNGNLPFWVLSDGRLMPEAHALLQELPTSTSRHHQQLQHHQLVHYLSSHRDRFGHTLLHLLASREGAQMQLLAAVLNSDDATLTATNTGGQTFLHVLAPGWFVNLHEPYAPLLQLLGHLRSRAPLSSAAGGSGEGGGDTTDGEDDPSTGKTSSAAHAIYVTDVYGRNFFHRLATFVEDPNMLAGLVQPYDRAALSRRDAFAHVPLAVLAPPTPALTPTPTSGDGGSSMAMVLDADGFPTPLFHDDEGRKATSLSPRTISAQQQQQQASVMLLGSTLAMATPAMAGGNVPMVFSGEDAFIRHHESLLRIVTASDSQPAAEDSQGRNGLQCLAEAIVDKRMMDEHRNALSSGRKLTKKKTLDRKEPGNIVTVAVGAGLLSAPSTGTGASNSEPTSDVVYGGSGGGGRGGGGSTSVSPYMMSSSSTSTATPPTTASTVMSATPTSSGNNIRVGVGGVGNANLLHISADGAQMATRLRLVQGLLARPTVVDVNHYDRRGQTVLTAFVVHTPDDQEDKAKSLVAMLEVLLAAGARLEGRNRRGETALLVAARLGRKIALTTLLDHGANVHARDAAGRGVLDVIDTQCRRHARHDVALYGRLEACRVLLTSIKQLPLGVKQRPTLLDEWTVRHNRGPEPRDLATGLR